MRIPTVLAVLALAAVSAALAAPARAVTTLDMGEEPRVGLLWTAVDAPDVGDVSVAYDVADGPGWYVTDANGVALSRSAEVDWACSALGPTGGLCRGDRTLNVNRRQGSGLTTLTAAADAPHFASAQLYDGPRDNRFVVGPGITADVFIGGGQDAVTASGPGTTVNVRPPSDDWPVDADLSRGVIVQGSNRTTLVGPVAVDVSSVGGRVRGTDGPDVITAAFSDVEAGEGDDVLTANEGHVDAGPGDDRVTVTGGPTRVTCGPGSDRVIATSPLGILDADCEQVAAFVRYAWRVPQSRSGVDPRPHRVPGQADRVRMRVVCAWEPDVPCRGTLRVEGRRWHAAKAFALGERARRWVTLRLPRGRTVRTGQPLRVTLRVHGGKSASWAAPVVR